MLKYAALFYRTAAHPAKITTAFTKQWQKSLDVRRWEAHWLNNTLTASEWTFTGLGGICKVLVELLKKQSIINHPSSLMSLV